MTGSHAVHFVRSAELKEYMIDVLPGNGRLAHEGAMTGIGIAGESGKACGDSCS